MGSDASRVLGPIFGVLRRSFKHREMVCLLPERMQDAELALHIDYRQCIRECLLILVIAGACNPTVLDSQGG